jgi:hypothetical protein
LSIVMASLYIWGGQSGTRLPFLCCGHNHCMDSLHSCFISSASLYNSVLDSVLHPNRLGLCFFVRAHNHNSYDVLWALIRILGTCHLPGKTLINVLYYIHPSSFNSVEVFFNTLLTVKSKSETVSFIQILGACHLPGKITRGFLCGA